MKSLPRNLPRNLIEYFSKSFTIAVKTNKNNVTDVENAIKAIVSHAFGDHSMCKESWCEGTLLDDKYQYHNLPNRKPLSDANLKKRLIDVFARYASNAKKIA